MTSQTLLWPIDTEGSCTLCLQKQLYAIHRVCSICGGQPQAWRRRIQETMADSSPKVNLCCFWFPYCGYHVASYMIIESALWDSVLFCGFSHWQSSSEFLSDSYSKLDPFLVRKLCCGRYSRFGSHGPKAFELILHDVYNCPTTQWTLLGLRGQSFNTPSRRGAHVCPCIPFFHFLELSLLYNSA